MRTLALLGMLFTVGCSQLSWISVGYRFEHESNGSKIFGTQQPNPGFEGQGLTLEAGIPLYEGSNTTLSGGVAYVEPTRIWAHDTMRAFRLSLRLEREALRCSNVTLDLGVGPLSYFPIDGKVPGVGGEVMFRVRYKLTEWIEPFVQGGAGLVWFPKRWGDQSTDWGFPLHMVAGLMFRF